MFLPDRGPVAPGPMSELDARIDALKTQLDELLRRYTDQHPDVVGTRRVIEQLEEERRGELRSARKGTEQVATGDRPRARIRCSSSFRIAARRIGGERRGAARPARGARGAADQLRSAAQSVPQIETEFRAAQPRLRGAEAATTRAWCPAASRPRCPRRWTPPRASRTSASSTRRASRPKPVSPNRPLLLPLVLLVVAGSGVVCELHCEPDLPDVPRRAGVAREPRPRPSSAA